MLKPAAMKKMDILVLSDAVDDLTESLGRMETIHLADVKPSEDVEGIEEVNVTQEIDLWEGVGRRAAALTGLLDLPRAEHPLPTPKARTGREIAGRLEKIEQTTKDLLSRKAAEQEALANLKSIAGEVESFALIDAEIQRINDFSFLHFAVGSMSDFDLKRMRDQYKDEEAILLPFATPSGEKKAIAITTKKKRWGIESDLGAAGFEKEDISEKYEGMPKHILEETERKREETQQKFEQINGDLAALREEHAEEVRAAAARARFELEILRAKEHFGKTASTTLISGWVPADKVDEVTRAVQGLADGSAFVETRDPASLKDVKSGRTAVPVLLNNPKFLKPFERIITTYGFPSYSEVEPTPFVALSFLLMFGLMFGDVGQGAVIALAGLAMYNIEALRKRCGDLGVVLVGAGVASAIFGLLYGSVFGSEKIISPLWRNPMEDVLVFFEVGLCVGMGLILLGILINIVNCLKRRDYLHGVFDKLGVVGGIFYVGCIGMTIKHIFLGHEEVSALLVAVMIVAPLVILFFREPIYNILTHQPGILHGSVGVYIMESLVELMETLTSFLANTVSFIRVSAFALSHVGLSIAVFALAEAMEEASGTALSSLVVIVLGNVLIILLEGLIATIQTIRLEYYEFFSKFFGGEGKAFKPFYISK
ncbi:MAG: V-type ATPase 116kDa subunit family protein [Planctomycetota bacterium]